MRRASLMLAVLSSVSAGSAFAQAPKDAPKPSAGAPAASAPVGTVPERTTATFGDWVMRCEATTAPVRRVCEVAQMMTLQGQAAPIAQVAFGRQASGEPMRVTLLLPISVTLTARPKILGEKDVKSAIELTWQRCVPAGCMAGAPVAEDIAARLGARPEPGSIVFKDAAERDLALPLSFRGLTQALAALGKEK